MILAVKQKKIKTKQNKNSEQTFNILHNYWDTYINTKHIFSVKKKKEHRLSLFANHIL